uniref:Uncharacterized protein n=1 Tax=Candidatus Kentrum sp. LFY TaxID=2126342 RepID=A0A450WME1_9GAMM|nr:MAG: hypothetical protein BECKLFY1418C_GA0070996_104011 [Candidatus Kentron sp. LFY]
MLFDDPIAVGIIVALIGFIIFIVVEIVHKKDIDVRNSAVIFSAIYAVFQGYQLIVTAVVGDPNNLPKAWRGYLGLAGVVVIGLSLQYILKTFRKVIEKPLEKKEMNDENE